MRFLSLVTLCCLACGSSEVVPGPRRVVDESCNANGDCEEGLLCYAGRCAVACADSDACRADQRCDSGACVEVEDAECGSDFDCIDLNPCFAPGSETCSEGSCHGTSEAASVGCDDGDPCTQGDFCAPGGVCAGTAKQCLQPPADSCVDADTVMRYPAIGTCNAEGECDYLGETVACANCEAQCLLSCAGVTCELPGGCQVSGRCVPEQPPRCEYVTADDRASCTLDGGGDGLCLQAACVECLVAGDCSEPAATVRDCYDIDCQAGTCVVDVATSRVCEPAVCAAGQASFERSCTAAGLCPDGGGEACAPFACDRSGGACVDWCDDDQDCAVGLYCQTDGTCTDQAPADPPSAFAGLQTWLDAETTAWTRGAVLLRKAEGEYLWQYDSQHELSGDVDFTVAGWFRSDTDVGFRTVFSKFDQSSTDRAWAISLDNADPALKLTCSVDGTAVEVLTGDSTSVGQWHFVRMQYDSATDTVGLQLDDGVMATLTLSGPMHDTANAAPVAAGALANGVNTFEGALDTWGTWTRLLTSSEATHLYNDGAGRSYGDLEAGLLTSMRSYWEMDESSDGRFEVTRYSSNSNVLYLYDHQTAPLTEGIVGDTESGEVVRWADSSGAGLDFENRYHDSRPSRVADAGNGMPAVRFDGVDDHMLGVSSWSSGAFTFIFVLAKKSPGRQSVLGWQLSPAGLVLERVAGQSLQRFGNSNFQYSQPDPRSSDGQVHIYEWNQPGMTAADVAGYQHRIDNEVIPKGQSGAGEDGEFGPLAVNNVCLGTGCWDEGYFHGDLFEMVVYDRQLTQDERLRLYRHLRSRYGL